MVLIWIMVHDTNVLLESCHHQIPCNAYSANTSVNSSIVHVFAYMLLTAYCVLHMMVVIVTNQNSGDDDPNNNNDNPK